MDPALSLPDRVVYRPSPKDGRALTFGLSTSRQRDTAQHVRRSLVVLGRASTRGPTPGRVTLAEARRLLRADGRCHATVTRHLARLLGGPLTRYGDTLIFAHWTDTMWPPDDPRWALWRTQKRAHGAARQARFRAGASTSCSHARRKNPLISKICRRVTPPGFFRADAHKDSLAPPAPCPARPVVAANAAERKPVPPPVPEADLAAVEDELARRTELKPKLEPEGKPKAEAVEGTPAWYAARAARMAALARTRAVDAAPCPAPAVVTHETAKVSHNGARVAPASDKPRRAAATLAQLGHLRDQHTWATSAGAVGLVSIARLGADYDLCRQAFDITAEARGRIRTTPGAFLHGTITKLMKGWSG